MSFLLRAKSMTRNGSLLSVIVRLAASRERALRASVNCDPLLAFTEVGDSVSHEPDQVTVGEAPRLVPVIEAPNKLQRA